MPSRRASGWMAMRTTQARSPVTRATHVPTTRPSLTATTAGSPLPSASMTSATTKSGAWPPSAEAFHTPTASSRSDASKSRMWGTAMGDLRARVAEGRDDRHKMALRRCRAVLHRANRVGYVQHEPPPTFSPPAERRFQPMCLAIPGQIVEVVDEPNRLAAVDVAGVVRNVNIGLLDDDADGGARPGDWVLIHVGFALSKVDEEEALATRKLLEGMGEDYEQELEELRKSLIE